MARPKSDDKRNSILAACQAVIIRDGLSATTADIAKVAGIATGSLFTYFSTKADLLNELYIVLKSEMTAELAGALTGGDDKEKLRRAWNAWTGWAAANAGKHQALELLRTSDQLTGRSRELGEAAVRPVFDLIRLNAAGKATGATSGFLFELINVVSIATMDNMASYPDRAVEYRDAGFEAVWRIIR